ncbi:hypothetical protein AGLY_018072 [Aphis glycines]|uniref:Uncharacterized protein n=1 Tax=Aphis glycines TaxID=307491 RepID=A0A6G0ST14_APHGL|nr:hypothetical protein AGLY_018072 [Aphis glycines]
MIIKQCHYLYKNQSLADISATHDCLKAPTLFFRGLVEHDLKNNSGPCIHPDLLAVPTHPAGKTNIGGIAQPVPLTAIHIVTKTPRSADVIAPICFFPLVATTLDALLKFMALDKLVASGCLRERLEFRFKIFVNQSGPAIRFFPHTSGYFRPSLCANWYAILLTDLFSMITSSAAALINSAVNPLLVFLI